MKMFKTATAAAIIAVFDDEPYALTSSQETKVAARFNGFIRLIFMPMTGLN